MPSSSVPSGLFVSRRPRVLVTPAAACLLKSDLAASSLLGNFAALGLLIDLAAMSKLAEIGQPTATSALVEPAAGLLAFRLADRASAIGPLDAATQGPLFGFLGHIGFATRVEGAAANVLLDNFRLSAGHFESLR